MATIEGNVVFASGTTAEWSTSIYVPAKNEVIIRDGVMYLGDGTTLGKNLAVKVSGATGATGATGPAGPTGPQGPAGTGTAITKLSKTAPVPTGTPAGFIIRSAS
jgi:hypothetical protein